MTESFFMGGIKEFVGGDKYDKLNKLIADMDASTMDEDLKTGLCSNCFHGQASRIQRRSYSATKWSIPRPSVKRRYESRPTQGDRRARSTS